MRRALLALVLLAWLSPGAWAATFERLDPAGDEVTTLGAQAATLPVPVCHDPAVDVVALEVATGPSTATVTLRVLGMAGQPGCGGAMSPAPMPAVHRRAWSVLLTSTDGALLAVQATAAQTGGAGAIAGAVTVVDIQTGGSTTTAGVAVGADRLSWTFPLDGMAGGDPYDLRGHAYAAHATTDSRLQAFTVLARVQDAADPLAVSF